MERNLESIIKEIAQNEEFSKEFIAMDEIDEIYAYCKEMGLNSSEEEFDEEVSSMIDNFDSNYSKIGDFELENVAGGSMLDKNFNKVVASALSALTIVGASAANSNFASAANASSASTNVKSSSKMEYAKEKFNKIKNSVLSFCKKHKIAVGATTAAIILVAIYGSVALYKKDANPLHWFRKKSGRSLNVVEMEELYCLKDLNKMSPQLKEAWDQLSEEDKKGYLAKRKEHGYYKNQTGETVDGNSTVTENDLADMMLGSLPDDSPQSIMTQYNISKRLGQEPTVTQDQYTEAYSNLLIQGIDRLNEMPNRNEQISSYVTFATELKNSIDSGELEESDFLLDNTHLKSAFSKLGTCLSDLAASSEPLPESVDNGQLNELTHYFQTLGDFSS